MTLLLGSNLACSSDSGTAQAETGTSESESSTTGPDEPLDPAPLACEPVWEWRGELLGPVLSTHVSTAREVYAFSFLSGQWRVSKWSAQGEYLWTNTYGGPPFAGMMTWSIGHDFGRDGELFTFGLGEELDGGHIQPWLQHLDLDAGEVAWTQSFAEQPLLDTTFSAARITAEGELLLVGIDLDEFHFAYLDPNTGALLEVFSGPATDTNDESVGRPVDVALMDTGEIWIAAVRGGFVPRPPALLKYSATGERLAEHLNQGEVEEEVEPTLLGRGSSVYHLREEPSLGFEVSRLLGAERAWARDQSLWSDYPVALVAVDSRERLGLVGSLLPNPQQAQGPGLWAAQLSSAGELLPGCYLDTEPAQLHDSAAGPDDGVAISSQEDGMHVLRYLPRPQ